MNVHQQLSTKEMFHMIIKTEACGIEGYEVDKKYVDPLEIIRQRQLAKVKKGEKSRNHVTKRGNFLDDEQKAHKLIPGPGKYQFADEWLTKKGIKVNYPDRKTYIDEVMKKEKKEKKPAPGHYEVTRTLKQDEAQKKRLSCRKVHFQDRLTYLDNIQFESSQIPGIGSYNPRQRAKTEATLNKTKPEDWRKKHDILSKKKPPKTPDMGTYKPMPSDFTLFENLKKEKGKKNLMGKITRFKTQASGSGLAPTKYSVVQQWRGKTVGKDRRQKHGLQVIARQRSKSVYY